MSFEEEGNVQIDLKSRQNNGAASAITEPPLAEVSHLKLQFKCEPGTFSSQATADQA